MSHFIRKNFPFLVQAKSWLLRMIVMILVFFSFIWYFMGLLDIISDSDALSATRREIADSFCVDRDGYSITRKEVQLITSKEIKNNYFMTIGIPTIERIQNGSRISYLLTTMKDLIKKIPERAKNKILIIILCADEDEESRRRVSENIRKNFYEFIESGMIHLIRVPKRFYYDFKNLPSTFNNTAVRMKWRSKQSLDYAFLFYFSYGLGKYHLQLEDDIAVDDDFFDRIEQDILNIKSKWIILHFCRMGFIGKLIKSEYLRLFADMFRMYFFEMPLDILYIRPFMYANLDDRFIPSSRFVFHHKGEFSSSKNAEP